MKRAIFPGSFDPITLGHVDIIERALSVVDELVIAVSINREKSHVFSLAQRMDLIGETFERESRILVSSFEGLLMDFVEKEGACVVVRGLRGGGDFEYEFQLASMNKKLNDEIETIFLMGSPQTNFLSSRLIKEIALLGGDISGMVPSHVEEALKRVFKRADG
jgi:pantetheine-phosphate adenylyltransferase